MVDKKILLLQGPMGPFFKRFASELQQSGREVVKVNFNAGDWIFYPDGISYKGRLSDWAAYLEELVDSQNIGQVFLFGDERSYHKIAINQVFNPKGIAVHVFEEGYLRPSFVTLEKDGVNGNSSLPMSPDYYLSKTYLNQETVYPAVKGQFFKSLFFSVVYGLAKFFGSLSYSNYQHHRCLNPFKQGILWLWGWLLKKPYYYLNEFRSYKRLLEKNSGKYFFVPLQVHNDFQISHSPYKDVKEFIHEVISSFAKKAPVDQVLVFKHHPMDRPYRNYRKLIKRYQEQFNLEGRVVYLHDQHLPTLLHHAKATIVINSTVGLSSLYHDVPVLVTGTAVYDIPGLTSQLSLDEFWMRPGNVNKELYSQYRLYLLNYNQGHGSFYQKGYANSPTGIHWPKAIPLFRTVGFITTEINSQPKSSKLTNASVPHVIGSSVE